MIVEAVFRDKRPLTRLQIARAGFAELARQTSVIYEATVKDAELESELSSAKAVIIIIEAVNFLPGRKLDAAESFIEQPYAVDRPSRDIDADKTYRSRLWTEAIARLPVLVYVADVVAGGRDDAVFRLRFSDQT